MAPQKGNRKFFQVNFGYRSLIDWANSDNWKRAAVGGGLSIGSSALTGPKGIPPKPQESQTANAYKVRGTKGMYWDINNWSKPALFDIKGDDRTSQVFDALDTNAQQWLYLAAEKMKAKGAAAIDEGKIAQSEIDNIYTFFSNPEEGTRAMGRALYVPYRGKMGIYEEWIGGKGYDDDRMGVGSTENLPHKFGRKGSQVQDEWLPSGGGPSHDYADMSRNTYGSKMFRTMVSGIKGQWIDSFAANVFNDPNALNKLAERIEKHQQLLYKRYEGGQFVPGGGRAPAGGLDAGSEIMEGSSGSKLAGGKAFSKDEGATYQELAVAGSGIGVTQSHEAATSYRGEKSGSNAIDIKFHEAVRPKTNRQAFSRADLTTDMFAKDIGQHGSGDFQAYQQSKGKTVNAAFESVDTATKEIADFYKNDRIPKLNNLMKLIQLATGSKNMWEARKKMGKAKSWKGQWEKFGSKENLKNLPAKGQKVITNILKDIGHLTYEAMFEDIAWVLHHMGNMLPGKYYDAEPYANVMRINISGQINTLMVIFALNQDGTYKNIGPKGSYIHIEESLPMEWLYDVANKRGWDGTFDEFVDMADGALVATGFAGVVNIGQAARLYSGSRINQRVAIGKVADRKMSAILDQVTSDIFEHYSTGVQDKLTEQVHDDAVKFSVAMRNPSKLPVLHKWWNFAREYLMTDYAVTEFLNRPSVSQDPTSPRSDGSSIRVEDYSKVKEMWEAININSGNRKDPFWFLWAAPYVSSESWQIGFAQQRGN